MPSKKEFLLAKTKHFGRHAVQKRASVAIWGWAWRARGWLRALQGPQPGPLPLPLPLMCEQLPPSQLRALWVQGPRSGPPMPQGLAKARPFGKAALMPRLRLACGSAWLGVVLQGQRLACGSANARPRLQLGLLRALPTPAAERLAFGWRAANACAPTLAQSGLP